MVHGENRIPYWIDRRLTGLAGPDYDAIISFGLPFEPEDSQYGEYRLIRRVFQKWRTSMGLLWKSRRVTEQSSNSSGGRNI